ncbi:MAG TPA: FtsW/RodA/SpoVE family cell cycle protein [Phycisphaerales bacterium]|nr:FtsW/RodA/SpoVE family cell cycle protein [Phycisphaerales bacterium]HMP37833.1 FtsW/RodA/SpoVE family cell cycle protein [Phycisphaerales bacterium]
MRAPTGSARFPGGASDADGGPPHDRWTPGTVHRIASTPQRLDAPSWINPGLLIAAAALALTALGVAAIGTTEPDLARRQALYAAVAFVGALLCATPSPGAVRRAAWPLYLAAGGLLVLVLVPFLPEAIVRPRNGARRWISLGITDFQPSEIAKIAVVLVLATWLRLRSHHRRLTGLLPPFLLTLAPMGLILVEPDLGTAILFIPVLLAMLLAAGARKRHIAAIVAMGLVAAPASYPVLEPHQRARVDALIAQIRGDTRYEQDIGFQGARAMTLIGAGGLAGVGKEHAAALVRFNALPEEHNDMIFAVVCTRWGAYGGAAVWGLFLLVAIGGGWIAVLAKEPFIRLVAVGFTTMLLAQAFINTGMTVGLLPITGMTLPFVSYGGSSLVAAWAMIGLLYGLALRRGPFVLRRGHVMDGAEEQR